MSFDLIVGFFLDLLSDLRSPGVLLQLCTIAFCALLGAGLARALRAVFSAGGTQPAGVGSLERVLSPLLVLGMIVLARHLLLKLHAVNLLVIVVPLVASLALMRFGFYLLRRIFVHQARMSNTLTQFEKLFALLVWVGGILYISGLWPDIQHFMDTTTLPVGHNKVSLATMLEAAASVALMLMLALWVGAVLEQRLLRMDIGHSSLRVVMARTVRALLILIALLVSLSFVGIDLTVLSVFGGALGVGLGLGMQRIAGSYVSGFVILLDRSLKIGDMISVDRYYGKVTQINGRYTVLEGLDGIDSVIPNEMLVSGVVQNYSLSDSPLWLSVRFTIACQSDIDSLLPLLAQAAATVPRVTQDPKPQTLLKNISGDGLELELSYCIRDPENGRSGVMSAVNRAALTVLRAHQIVLPTLKSEIRIIEGGVSSITTDNARGE
jgi:small-conductance mechanosensitive channel